MKLLMENWRKYLNEENLNEVLYGMDDLPEDFKVVVSYDPGTYRSGLHGPQYIIQLWGIERKDFKGNPAPFADGYIQTMDQDESPWCYDNNIFMSAGTESEIKGWGPFLYDIMIEYATLKGGGLTPHKEGGQLTPDSERVWRTYFNNKKGAIAKDVLEIIPIPPGRQGCSQTGLDEFDLEREFRKLEDDCKSKCEDEHGVDERAEDTGNWADYTDEHWECEADCEDKFGVEELEAAQEKINKEKGPFAHMVYRKAPTTIKALGERFIDNT